MSMAAEVTAPPINVPTPCIGVCQLDEENNHCLGCGRTGEEVAAWQDANSDYKLGVWDALSTRRAELALGTYRLPWAPIDIICMIERTLRRRWGRWVLGLNGASASFGIGANEDADIMSREDAVTAITARGALRMQRHEKVIAVAFGDTGDGNGPEAIGLVLPRGRIDLPRAGQFTHTGADVSAICGMHRDARLYDFGLSSTLAARFCLRTDDEALIDALKLAEGKNWQDAFELAKHAIEATSPHTVVETGLGRAEIFAPPMTGTDLSAYAELNADALDVPTELPSGWELPSVFALCALFFPHSRKPAQSMLDGHY